MHNTNNEEKLIINQHHPGHLLIQLNLLFLGMSNGNVHAHNLSSLSNVYNDDDNRKDPMCSVIIKLDRRLVMTCQ